MPIRSYALYPPYLYVSDDSGSSWNQINLTAFFPIGSSSTFPRSISCDPYSINNVIIAGSALTGIQISNTGGSSWTQVPGTTGGVYPWLNIKYKDSLNLIATSNKISLSTDGGNTFTDTGVTAAILYPSSGVNLVTALAYNNNSVGFLSVYDKLYRSNDGGVTWFVCNSDSPLQASVYIRAIAYKDDVVLVSTDQKVYRSDDGALTFTEVLTINTCNVPIPEYKKSDLYITSGDTLGVVCVDCTGEVYTSDDGGQTWLTLGAVAVGINQDKTGVFVYDETQPVTNFIVGANAKLYRTSNGGITYTTPISVAPKFYGLDSTFNVEPCGECPTDYTYNSETGYCEANLISSALCPEGYTYNLITGDCEAPEEDPITPSPCPESCTTIAGVDDRGYCECLQQIPFISCCYSLTDCSGISDTIYTSSDLISNIGQIVKIEGCDTCWIVDSVPEGCPEIREVTIDSTYATCIDCLPVYDCNTCPEGYTLNAQNECELVTITPAVYTGTTTTVETGDKSNSYGNLSLCLLEDISSYTFPVLGTGISNSSYDFKDNDGAGVSVARVPGYSPLTFGVGTGTILNQLWWSSPVSGTSDGRLNIAGVWAPGINNCNPYTNTPAGCENEPGYYLLYTYCINVQQEKQYTIGVAADNEVHVNINGTTVLKLSSQNSGTTIPFRNWTVFPFTLPAGQNVIELKGFNFDGFAAFAAEIYDLTKDEFIANVCTPGVYSGGWTDPGSTPADLEPFIVFTTRDTIGQVVPSGDGEYVCPDGGVVDFCTGDPICPCTTYLPVTTCCNVLVDCTDIENTISTATDLTQYEGKIIQISGYTECWIITTGTEPCLVPNPVTVTDSFDECEICLPSYALYNCKDINIVIYTGTNLEAVLGKTINIEEFPNDCWQVGPNTEKILPLQPVTQSGDAFDSCDECDPPKYQLTNCLNEDSIIITDTDLSANLNQIVTVEGIPGICFLVSNANCDCIEVTTNVDTYTVTSITQVNGRRQYFIDLGSETVTLAWDSTEEQWVIFNPDTEILYAYTTLDSECPLTSYWILTEDAPFTNIVVSYCINELTSITVSGSFTSCEPCINC